MAIGQSAIWDNSTIQVPSKWNLNCVKLITLFISKFKKELITENETTNMDNYNCTNEKQRSREEG